MSIFSSFFKVMFAAFSTVALSCSALICADEPVQEKATIMDPSFPWNLELKDLDGKVVSLSTWKNKVLLIVNIATKCGFSNQMDKLQVLYDKYKEKGFVVLAFPSNDFMHQEPGKAGEIKERCALHSKLTYPIFDKIAVKGEDMHPLFKWLTDKQIHKKYGGSIIWSYSKFLINRQGELVDRFAPITSPENASLAKAIEKCLSEETTM